MRITALLPMKGHSERVPNKNLRSMCGKPLFFYVAEVLNHCKWIDNIIINTDSEKIAELAQQAFSKVIIHWRPEAICGNMVSMNTVIANDLERHEGEHYVQTHSTNPLITSQTINRAIEEYLAKLKMHDSLFSVTQLQTRLYWESGKPVNHTPDQLLRTQDLPPLFMENSNIYLFSKTSFLNAKRNRIGRTPQMFTIDPLEALDIDEKSDFVMAEALFIARRKSHI
ncbi:MAG: acylneuraminate cytidylyltransferase family protein [Desulfobacula sp.]|jgi:CMP-N-acetylneuraminic acid synthetase|nr:acylneuraminate cytidylyltransferase family protein [Desulfobacula sp.]